MSPSWRLQTGRLVLRPVGWADLEDLTQLKGDPRAFATMLGGVRSRTLAAEELATDISDWSRLGYGIWTIRQQEAKIFAGMIGLQERPDQRGVGLRFALLPGAQRHGYASEAAGAAIRFGHDMARLQRIIAVVRDDNFASRTVLGSIGMVEAAYFWRDGVRMVIYESVRRPAA